jgi:hypothetical protein
LRVPQSITRGNVLSLVALAGLAVPLVALAGAGLFSRYAADDYCTAGQIQMAGFLDAQSRLYVGWSGRFAATFLITLLELIGPTVVPFLPGLALLAWLAAAALATREVLETLGWQLPVVSVVLMAAVVVFATLSTTADLPQVLYWQTGLVTYLSPLVIGTLYVAWVTHIASARAYGIPWPLALGASFALAFAAGGTSETFAAAQVTALVLAVAIAWLAGARQTHSRLQWMLIAGVLGALLALVIIAVSPGNEVRQDTAARTALSVALPQAVEFTQGWLRLTFARPHAAVLALLIGVPAAIAAAYPRTLPVRVSFVRRPGLVLLAGLLASGLVILAGMLPAFYALGSNPPGRAQVIPQFVLVCSVAILSWISGTMIGAHLRSKMSDSRFGWAAAGVLVVVLALGPLFSATQVFAEVSTARAYAAAWDQVDREVRADRSQGVLDVTVEPLPSTGTVQNLQFVGADRSDWFNDCVARYYRVSSIAVPASAGLP